MLWAAQFNVASSWHPFKYIFGAPFHERSSHAGVIRQIALYAARRLEVDVTRRLQLEMPSQCLHLENDASSSEDLAKRLQSIDETAINHGNIIFLIALLTSFVISINAAF